MQFVSYDVPLFLLCSKQTLFHRKGGCKLYISYKEERCIADLILICSSCPCLYHLSLSLDLYPKTDYAEIHVQSMIALRNFEPFHGELKPGKQTFWRNLQVSSQIMMLEILVILINHWFGIIWSSRLQVKICLVIRLDLLVNDIYVWLLQMERNEGEWFTKTSISKTLNFQNF